MARAGVATYVVRTPLARRTSQFLRHAEYGLRVNTCGRGSYVPGVSPLQRAVHSQASLDQASLRSVTAISLCGKIYRYNGRATPQLVGHGIASLGQGIARHGSAQWADEISRDGAICMLHSPTVSRQLPVAPCPPRGDLQELQGGGPMAAYAWCTAV